MSSPSFPHSYYTSSSTQSWHCAAPHGPFAFCLSLTKWDERHFSGGETMLLQPNVLATDEVRWVIICDAHASVLSPKHAGLLSTSFRQRNPHNGCWLQ